MTLKCPICAKPVEWVENPNRPFCSERCRLIDLGRWASEEYHVSVPLTDASEEEESPDQRNK